MRIGRVRRCGGLKLPMVGRSFVWAVEAGVHRAWLGEFQRESKERARQLEIEEAEGEGNAKRDSG
jgi:hypothetical protein